MKLLRFLNFLSLTILAVLVFSICIEGNAEGYGSEEIVYLISSLSEISGYNMVKILNTLGINTSIIKNHKYILSIPLGVVRVRLYDHSAKVTLCLSIRIQDSHGELVANVFKCINRRIDNHDLLNIMNMIYFGGDSIKELSTFTIDSLICRIASVRKHMGGTGIHESPLALEQVLDFVNKSVESLFRALIYMAKSIKIEKNVSVTSIVIECRPLARGEGISSLPGYAYYVHGLLLEGLIYDPIYVHLLSLDRKVVVTTVYACRDGVCYGYKDRDNVLAILNTMINLAGAHGSKNIVSTVSRTMYTGIVNASVLWILIMLIAIFSIISFLVNRGVRR